MVADMTSLFTEDDARLHTPDAGNGARRLYFQIVGDNPLSGRYEIEQDVLAPLESLNRRERARLGSLVLEAKASGEQSSQITRELIAEAVARTPIRMHERAMRMLRYMHDRTTTAGRWVMCRTGGPRMLLHSESTEASEVQFLLEYLADSGWIKLSHDREIVPPSWLLDAGDGLPWNGEPIAMLTVDGFTKIVESVPSSQSNQAFVAMWFGDEVNRLYREGLVPAIEDAGFEPFRVDQSNAIHRIDDEIIAQIRQSRFVVADFTHGDDGARGGVYYEAGFAHGLGIKVIFTCREDQADKLHFDTRQYRHILWQQPDDLRQELSNCIQATVGRGTR